MKKTDFPTGRSGAFHMMEGHDYIGRGLVYCPEAARQRPPEMGAAGGTVAFAPRVTHSRVICSFCGKTIQRATNPPPPIPGKVVNDRGQVLFVYRSYDQLVKWLVAEGIGDWATVDGLGWKFKPLSKKNPVAAGKSPVAQFLKAEMMGGKTPAAALRAVSRRFKGRVSRAALRDAFNAVRTDLMGGLDGDRTALADWAGMAGMRMGSYRKFSKNPTAAQLRGAADALVQGRVFTPDTARQVVREALTYGMDRLPGRHRDMLKAALSYLPKANPVVHRYNGKGPVHIYGRTEKIFMQKTRGPYKGQKFVHDFKGNVEQVGLPKGTIVRFPNGQSARFTTRSVVLTGPKDLWRRFRA